MTVRLLDPNSDADLAAGLELWRAIGAHDLPDDPPPGLTEVTWWMQDTPRQRVEAWVVPAADGLAGLVRLVLPDAENAHMSWAELQVRPSARRRGIGRELYAHALDRLAADGRRTLNVSAPDTAAARAFADAVGLALTQHKSRYVYRFDRVDAAARDAIAASAAAPSGDYSLVRWVGPCPDEHLDAFVRVEAGMLDSPIIDAVDYVPTAPDPAQLRDQAVRDAKLGITEYVLCARADATGEFAGTTRVYVLGGGRAEQDDTTVLPAYRGHRLGLRMKAEMLRWLAAAEPGLVQVETWNDLTNEPMIRVNEALGCTFAEDWPTWTRTVP